MAKVHLVNPMRNPAGGSEHRTIALFELIAEVADVQVWTEEEPHSAFLGQVPVRKIGPPANFPQGGNLVFVGTYFSIGGWLKAANPSRVILIHNLDQPDRLRQIYGALGQIAKPEVVYASEGIAKSTPEIKGVVHESPIDLNLFAPAPRLDRPFTVGRLSRDVPEKHHPDDVEVYHQLADQGTRVRLMGAECLGISHPGIEVLPENAQPASDFLKSLDCFFYRTAPVWREAYGRVIFEAMACGLPVVAESRHGYAERLTDGVNYLKADDNEMALQAVLKLSQDAELKRSIGASARSLVESIYGSEYRSFMQEFYTR